MALPLPRVIPDVGPGGGITDALSSINSLYNARQEAKYNAEKAKWASITLPAQALSQTAYATQMGPQYTAKLLKDSGILASMTPEQQEKALSLALGPSQNGNAVANLLNQFQTKKPQEGIGTKVINHLLSKLGIGESGQQQNSNPLAELMQGNQTSQSTNAMMDMTGPRAMQSGQMDPTQPYKPNNDMTGPMTQSQVQAGLDDITNPAQSNKSDTQVELPELPPVKDKNKKSWEERRAAFDSIIKEGEVLGKNRGEAVKDLDLDYKQALQVEKPLKDLGKIIANPVFQKLRTLPGFQKIQMKGKKDFFGNKEEQKLIGEFQTAARNIVTQTVKGMGNRILASEIPLAESMKISDEDNLNVMLGKYPAIVTLNEMTKERSRLASEIIKKEHVSEGEALERADKMVNGDAIRSKVEKELEPEITEEDIEATLKANPSMNRQHVLDRLKKEGRPYNG